MLENEALKAEVEEAHALVQEKEANMQRIYQKLQEKKPQADSHMIDESQAPANQNRQVEFEMLLNSLEKKTTEILELKTTLQDKERKISALN